LFAAILERHRMDQCRAGSVEFDLQHSAGAGGEECVRAPVSSISQRLPEILISIFPVSTKKTRPVVVTTMPEPGWAEAVAANTIRPRASDGDRLRVRMSSLLILPRGQADPACRTHGGSTADLEERRGPFRETGAGRASPGS
jgi:hypothetical protein